MMDLSPRQRAMLVEMRVPPWWPQTSRVGPQEAAPTPSAVAATAPVEVKQAPATDSKKALPVRQAGLLSWRLEIPQTLYASAPRSETLATGGCLIVTEAFWAPEAPASDWLQGPARPPAGHLLDNLLQATQWPQNACVSVLGLRAMTPKANTEESPETLPADLAEWMGRLAPNVVLLMGRVAAQQALQTTEPLGKLRGQLHTCHGIPAVVTLDVPSLLRHPADKGRVWTDLGLALPFMKN